jgi:hypothetical protein
MFFKKNSLLGANNIEVGRIFGKIEKIQGDPYVFGTPNTSPRENPGYDT